MSKNQQGDLKKLPLNQWHIDHDARMVPFAGYSMPVQYEGVMAEHLWTRENAGLFDVSHMGQLRFTGEDRVQALEAFVPGAMATLKTGKMRYSLLLAEDGGILDDLMITNVGDALSMVVNGATKFDDIAYIRDHLPDDVQMTHLQDHALLALQGPKAADALCQLVPAVADLFFMEYGRFEWQGITLDISRSGYTGEDGFEISIAADEVNKLADALATLDAVKPIGLGARDSLRLEAGLPLYGHDLNPEILPVEANLNFALHKSRRERADYAGAAQVLAQYPDKSDILRVGLFVEGRQPVREGARVIDDAGRDIGRVTSGGFSPSLQRPIAMAYVPRAAAAAGTDIMVEQRGKTIACRVTDMPFVPHQYHRPKKA